MLPRPQLVNILVFMDRATCTGKEALGWAETYQAVQREINAIDNSAAPPISASSDQSISPEIEA